MELPHRENPFTPLFGEIPYSLIGRRDEIRHIERAFSALHQTLIAFTLITGARGSGKTALLTYAAQAAEQRGWIAVNSYAVVGMLDVFFGQACDIAAHIIDVQEPSRLSSVTAGPVAFSWEKPVGTQATWHTRMTRLLSQLKERGTGLLFTLDEVRADLDEVIMLASSCQIFLCEGCRVGLFIAGLPRATSQLINHEPTSFLRRATQFKLGSVADYDAQLALEKTIRACGKTIEPDALRIAALATGGYPFMIQLVGYCIWEWGEDHDALSVEDAAKGISYAQREFNDRILAPSFFEMSAGDRAFAAAMLDDEEYSTVSDIARRMGRGNSCSCMPNERGLNVILSKAHGTNKPYSCQSGLNKPYWCHERGAWHQQALFMPEWIEQALLVPVCHE